MADERFQKCMMTWYFSIRRLATKYLVDDLAKLEFSQAELAYIDMEVGGIVLASRRFAGLGHRASLGVCIWLC